MKELTIEEKARAYDEAIEKAKITLGCCNSESIITKHAIYDIFPELQKSKDEKIREALIILLRYFCKGYRVPGLNFSVSYKEMLDWLEQLEQQSDHHITCSEEHMKVLNEVLDFAANHENPYWNDYIF